MKFSIRALFVTLTVSAVAISVMAWAERSRAKAKRPRFVTVCSGLDPAEPQLPYLRKFSVLASAPIDHFNKKTVLVILQQLTDRDVFSNSGYPTWFNAEFVDGGSFDCSVDQKQLEPTENVTIWYSTDDARPQSLEVARADYDPHEYSSADLIWDVFIRPKMTTEIAR